MPGAPGRTLPARKRQRQAVVCTGCRRRKIACDRKSPCAQCVQAHLECTYYARNDFQTDNRHSTKAKSHSSLSAPSTQAMHYPSYSSGPPSESLANVDYQKNFSVPDLMAASAAHSIDMSASSWFDTEILGTFNQPLSTPIDVSPKTLFPDTATALSDPSRETGQPAAFPPQASLYSEVFSAEPGKVLFSKSRLYGSTHWITILRKYEQQGLFDDVVSVLFRSGSEGDGDGEVEHEREREGEGHPLLQKCKRLARQVKSKVPNSRSLSRPLQDYMPPRDTCDELVRLYLRTFEAVLRVLHVPSFQRDYLAYWANPQAASESLVLQLLLVMAIGACFYQDVVATEGGTATLHCQATHWIHACYVRLAAPFRKRQLSLRRVQSQCLLVIALQTNTSADGGDLAGSSVAVLVQSAMAVGLHIAPSQLPVNSLEAEIRRRLWATILELVVQSSLDSGIHPVISAEALNCEFPSNLNDAQFCDSTEALPTGHPISTFTQSSIQRALLRSLSIRFRIAEALSRFQGELPYDTALRMGAELTAACRETSKLIDSFLSSPPTVEGARPRAFQIKIQDLLARRFLLLLHAQFAHKATSDVAYHFSRTVCQECSLLLLSPPSSSQNSEPTSRRRSGADDDDGSDGECDAADTDTDTGAGAASWSSLQDYANLQLLSGGLFKNTFLAASLTVCAEILQQLREDSSPATSSLSRRELLQALEHTTHLTRRRVRAGETSVKAAAFFACMHASIGARRALPQRDLVVTDTVRAALTECCAVLEARLRGPIAPGVIYVDVPDVSRVERQLSDSSLSIDGSHTWHTSPWKDDAGFLC